MEWPAQARGARARRADPPCAGLAYFGFRFAFMTFLLDGPILFSARPERGRCGRPHTR